MDHPARNSDPSTSHESARAVKELAAKLRARIVALASAAGQSGITISEAEDAIPEHKNASVSPRFAELVRRGYLVRVLRDDGKPMTRFDTETKRSVIVHWLPEFAPFAPKKEQQELPLEDAA
ncbi:MAG: hypothetical protein WB952_08105 [Terriglobales bacterium]